MRWRASTCARKPRCRWWWCRVRRRRRRRRCCCRRRAQRSRLHLRQSLRDGAQHVHRNDDGIALVPGDHRQRLQVAQLHCLGLRGQRPRGLEQLLGGLQLTLSQDHLRAALALGFGLARHGAYHVLVEVDVLGLHHRHLDAPGVGLRVEHALDVEIELLALGQHLVHLVLAEHRAQGGLRQLAGGHQEVFHLDDRLGRVDHAEVHHRVHLHRHVVARDHILRWHVHGYRAQVHLDHLLYARDDDDPAGALHLPEAAELEHHAAFVLAQDADRVEQRGDDEYEDDGLAQAFYWLHSFL